MSGTLCITANFDRQSPVRVIRVASMGGEAPPNVHCSPIATESVRRNESSRRAKTGREQSQHDEAYSITSSALTSRVFGTVKPSAFATFRLMLMWNFVGC